MTDSTMWWLMAGALVAFELVTGTFYLLMIAVGFMAAALAAHAGLGLTGQLVCAGVVGIAAVVGWRIKKSTQLPGAAEPADNFDVGEVVQIQEWKFDGTAQVKYRGAQWVAVHRTGVAPSPGSHRVAELIGNRLLVDKI